MNLPVHPHIRKVFIESSPEMQDVFIARLKEITALKQEVAKLNAWKTSMAKSVKEYTGREACQLCNLYFTLAEDNARLVSEITHYIGGEEE